MAEFQRKVIDAAARARLALVCHDLLDRIEALEQAIKPATPPDPAIKPVPAPNPTPPPVRGVTVEELVGILVMADWRNITADDLAWLLLNHHRTGPLLRGEGQGKRVELPEEPPWDVLPALSTHYKHYERVAHGTWTAARDEVARQQGEP